MIDADRREFADLLTATMQVYGAQLGTAAIGIWWAALGEYPIAAVRAGLSAHVTDRERGKFPPRPADVISQLTAADGRPGADEAWARCPFTEAQTVVWTAEMRSAWMIAKPLLEADDAIAARMAFKDAYHREVDLARRRAAPVEWEVSLGHHLIGREAPIVRAVALGLIPAAQAQPLLPGVNLETSAPVEALPAPLGRR